MSGYRFCFHTDAAAIAMTVVCGAAHTANSTGITVKLPLVFIIQQYTGGTPVGAQSCVT